MDNLYLSIYACSLIILFMWYGYDSNLNILDIECQSDLCYWFFFASNLLILILCFFLIQPHRYLQPFVWINFSLKIKIDIWEQQQQQKKNRKRMWSLKNEILWFFFLVAVVVVFVVHSFIQTLNFFKCPIFLFVCMYDTSPIIIWFESRFFSFIIFYLRLNLANGFDFNNKIKDFILINNSYNNNNSIDIIIIIVLKFIIIIIIIIFVV